MFAGRLCALGLVAVVAAAALTACTTAGGQAAPAQTPAPVGQLPSSMSSSAPPSAASSTSPGPVLPAGCPDLLSLPDVEKALGLGIIGQVTYLRAAAVAQSGRTGRVTCGYGVPIAPSTTPGATASTTSNASPLVQASYITYVDAKTAASRVALTVQTDGAQGAVQSATVAGKPASVLVGAQLRELVMADGARTIVVEASPTVLAADKAPAALTAMAAIMLRFGQPAASAASAALSVPAAS